MSDQDNIIISNQERKKEVFNPIPAIDRRGTDGQATRQRKTSQGNRQRLENLSQDKY